jgi:hypothetical protein
MPKPPSERARKPASAKAKPAAKPESKPATKSLSAIWVNSDTHRQAKIAVGFMIGTAETRYQNMTLGLFTELAILDRLEKFYEARGMSMSKIAALKAAVQDKIRGLT